MQIVAPENYASVAKAALIFPATPECALCHVAGLAQTGGTAIILLGALSANGTVTLLQEHPPTEGVETHLSPRAPPAL